MRLFIFAVFLCLLIAGPWLAAAFSAGTHGNFENLIGKHDALLVTAPNEKIIFSKNSEKMLVPASTLKIFTALVALHYLGPDYKFATEFYLDKGQNLKIKGYGDPLLISEVLQEISKKVAGKIEKVIDIVLDDSYFAQPLTIPGVSSSIQPYDAPNGALCVNFNTVNFKQSNGIYISAEPQTPLVPFALNRIKKLGLHHGRIVFSHNNNECTFYAGYLIKHFLNNEGLQTTGIVRTGRVHKSKDRLIFRYISKSPVKEIISRFLEFSNNYTTNQLLIAAGAKTHGPPGTLDKGVSAALSYAKKILDLKHTHITEGSGISRKNKTSAKDMDKVLKAFEPYHGLMRHEGREFYKTGTLSGINTRAGYIEHPTGQLYRFVVFINTPGKSTRRIMKKLHYQLNCGANIQGS
ncbi:MAG: D-alanyl-D-alanine carboxypeptidase [Thermodesulfobacteriota bacterium]|nr:D-alanyl-D-alanine carboxypeptidase [Thermodesulfobacteriota bacterium]